MQRTAIFIVLSIVALAGCGGSSSSDSGSDGNPSQNEPDKVRNVALESNGGTARASYDSDSAPLVNDGESKGQYWAGMAQGDTVTVDFDAQYALSEIRVITNSGNNSDTELQYASDGNTYQKIGYLAGSPTCFELQLGSGAIECGLDPEITASSVRVKITASNAEAKNVQVFEIQAQGH